MEGIAVAYDHTGAVSSAETVVDAGRAREWRRPGLVSEGVGKDYTRAVAPAETVIAGGRTGEWCRPGLVPESAFRQPFAV